MPAYSQRWARPRKDPARCGHACFDGIAWRDVPDYYWSRLTRHAGELTLATVGVGVVNGRLVQFAGH